MKYIHTYKGYLGFIMTFIVVMITGCTDDMPVISNNKPVIDGDSFTVTGTISIPGMQQAITRGKLSESPGDGLLLTVFEYDLGDSPESSFLSNIYIADLLEETGGNDKVQFNLTMKTSGSPKTLHFMLTDETLTAKNGSVASLLPSLYVGENYFYDDDDDDPGQGGILMYALGARDNTSNVEKNIFQEAYWGKVDFPYGYIQKTADGKPKLDENEEMILRDDVVEKLTDIPLIRNFAQISMTVNKDVNNFELKGFKIVNVPNSGTIGPWNTEKHEIPKLLGEDGKMLKYSDIDYNGIVPGDAIFQNQEWEAKEFWGADDFNATSAFIYEHPYESTRRSYLIVYGIYKWTDADTSTPQEAGCFYKIDIGDKDENNVFQYYNIIRNIHYKVVINSVDAKGYATVEEAIEHLPSNNVSASTETSSMLNISDGKNLLILNKLNHIVVEKNDTVTILYRYIENVSDAALKEENNDVPKPDSRLTTGDVIKSIDGPTSVTIDGVNWEKITLEINDPPATGVKTKSFSIIDGRGLSRTINITLRKPWKYMPIGNTGYYATVARGEKNLYELSAPEDISSEQGENFTVYFNLPDGLKESMFPLVFQLEAKAQGIENNKKGTLVVTSGPSLFDPNVTSISYLKKVSYKEYMYKYNSDNEIDVSDDNKNTNHTIRCRFTTIMEAVLDDAEIKIHNEYFSPDISVIFKRRAL